MHRNIDTFLGRLLTCTGMMMYSSEGTVPTARLRFLPSCLGPLPVYPGLALTEKSSCLPFPFFFPPPDPDPFVSCAPASKFISCTPFTTSFGLVAPPHPFVIGGGGAPAPVIRLIDSSLAFGLLNSACLSSLVIPLLADAGRPGNAALLSALGFEAAAGVG